jgi:hypothetical protein
MEWHHQGCYDSISASVSQKWRATQDSASPELGSWPIKSLRHLFSSRDTGFAKFVYILGILVPKKKKKARQSLIPLKIWKPLRKHKSHQEPVLNLFPAKLLATFFNLCLPAYYFMPPSNTAATITALTPALVPGLLPAHPPPLSADHVQSSWVVQQVHLNDDHLPHYQLHRPEPGVKF